MIGIEPASPTTGVAAAAAAAAGSSGGSSAEGKQEEEPLIVFTVGHSSRSVQELAGLLVEHGVKTLVDVRTAPRSRTNPQFNKDALPAALEAQRGACRYAWLGRELGGLRKRNKALGAMNGGWDNASFQGYADYMQSPEFRQGLGQLLGLARDQGPICLMCAETCYWQCHRMLVSDALHVRGVGVRHLMQAGKTPLPHKLTKFARVEGERITYPPYEGHGLAAADQQQQQQGEGEAQGAAAGQRGIGSFFKPAAKEEEERQERGQPRQDAQQGLAAQQSEQDTAAAAGAGQNRGIGRYFTRLSAKEAEEQAEREHKQTAATTVAAGGAAAGTSSRQGDKGGKGGKGIAAFFETKPKPKRRREEKETE
ncbi:hypothetical protein ABPG75_013579 [Micractinium tetrahymenae]